VRRSCCCRGLEPLDRSDKVETVTDEEVIGAALAMSDTRRAHLAHLLYASLDDEPAEQLTQAEWEEAWVEEAERRLAQMREGKVKGIPGEQVFASVRDLLRP
jgi:putative addiction module component (TIGR02574 family)